MKFSFRHFLPLIATLNFAFLGILSAEESKALDEALTNPQLWSQTREEFQQATPRMGFRWTSKTRQSARSDGQIVALSFLNRPVGETIVAFHDDTPSNYQIAIFARGDDGNISKERFESTLEDWKGAMTKFTKQSPREVKSRGVINIEGYSWHKENIQYKLEYSFKKAVRSRNVPFTGEFIRLRASSPNTAQAKKQLTKKDLPKFVKKERNGDVYIQGVPMVDQGAKGYCVVASTARVFGYYGMQVDQNELAEMAGASAENGTNTAVMIDSLKRTAQRFKLRVKTHSELSYDDMEDLSEDYNRFAKKAKKQTVPESRSSNLWYNLDQFDPEVLKSARLRSTADFERFKKEVRSSIDVGIPLLWTVTLGIYEEPKRISQTRGGHMRMIIGYNTKTDEIIFSDSWGAGHEAKRWGAEEAFCSTSGLYSMAPYR